MKIQHIINFIVISLLIVQYYVNNDFEKKIKESANDINNQNLNIKNLNTLVIKHDDKLGYGYRAEITQLQLLVAEHEKGINNLNGPINNIFDVTSTYKLEIQKLREKIEELENRKTCGCGCSKKKGK